jgi:myo-inositol-1(or 4)-monophosphatase
MNSPGLLIDPSLVEEAVRSAGRYIRSQITGLVYESPDSKRLNDLVTHVDKTSEFILSESCSKILPEAGFIREETGYLESQNGYYWCIDPLDGTTNFVHGIPVFSISVALLRNDEPIAGWVYEINRDEMFFAMENQGAWLNNKRIKVSKSRFLEDSVIATGFPYSDFSYSDEYLSLFGEIMRKSRGIRRLGSAAVDLAYVACGRFDAFFESHLNPWDVAAGLLLVSEAGGTLSDYSRGRLYLSGAQVLASTPGIFSEIHAIARKFPHA